MKILYIDDEADIREVALMSLELDSDLEVRDAGSGAEGLALAAAWRPDLIMLDVMMPVMDGPTTLEKLRENPVTEAIPVVFITARAQPGEIARFEALGARGVIPKPFDPMTLAETVRSHLP